MTIWKFLGWLSIYATKSTSYVFGHALSVFKSLIVDVGYTSLRTIEMHGLQLQVGKSVKTMRFVFLITLRIGTFFVALCFLSNARFAKGPVTVKALLGLLKYFLTEIADKCGRDW